ncbi:protein arginine N-methyltransferase 1 [Drosophila albomicans]|uniref:Protein arginine N-methyltransferase 6 n=1 Tax=Drosophila albomicans TaxID=7291 RepID=A0A9C6ST13_DROAB|nr:protein arginine N-methyltransferase 1 [Drosophila albomicans]
MEVAPSGVKSNSFIDPMSAKQKVCNGVVSSKAEAKVSNGLASTQEEVSNGLTSNKEQVSNGMMCNRAEVKVSSDPVKLQAKFNNGLINKQKVSNGMMSSNAEVKVFNGQTSTQKQDNNGLTSNKEQVSNGMMSNKAGIKVSNGMMSSKAKAKVSSDPVGPQAKLYNGLFNKQKICNGLIPKESVPQAVQLAEKPSNRGGRRRHGRSCPRLPTPTRFVPPELQSVNSMTSADFRHDHAAHVENMRTRQKDQQHMHFFQTMIEDNKHLFVGRCILVVSCGSGTLALMAAQAGATQVYAIDRSNATDYARLVVKENHYEHVIKVLHGRVKELELEQPVDGIICNWMGHCLLFESELVQLLQARDRWLKPNGFILPDLGSLYLLGADEQRLKNETCNWWLDVYGFNMKALRRYSLAEPRYARIKGDRLLTKAHKVLSLDLNTASMEQLRIERNIRLQVQREGYLECFLLYFDVAFSRAHQPLKLSCNPWLGDRLKSLWLQTVLFVDQPFVMRCMHEYVGQLTFKPVRQAAKLSQLNLHEMQLEIELSEIVMRWSRIVERRVKKMWLMLPRFQSVHEVEACQDQLPL